MIWMHIMKMLFLSQFKICIQNSYLYTFSYRHIYIYIHTHSFQLASKNNKNNERPYPFTLFHMLLKHAWSVNIYILTVLWNILSSVSFYEVWSLLSDEEAYHLSLGWWFDSFLLTIALGRFKITKWFAFT